MNLPLALGCSQLQEHAGTSITGTDTTEVARGQLRLTHGDQVQRRQLSSGNAGEAGRLSHCRHVCCPPLHPPQQGGASGGSPGPFSSPNMLKRYEGSEQSCCLERERTGINTAHHSPGTEAEKEAQPVSPDMSPQAPRGNFPAEPSLSDLPKELSEIPFHSC